ncbi:MAG: hypothetical protein JJ921_02100 [Pseudomonadales bacterium]|nr:hypothetical protein [Pseudomonadales bacterium]MBO7005051.1 hypothetical protein [Pseudomonadales bacterium]
MSSRYAEEWLPMCFGKHKGRTLPQIMFVDADWFYWCVEEGVFKNSQPEVRRQARRIYDCSRSIAIPERLGRDMVVEHYLHPYDGYYDHFNIVPRTLPPHVGESRTYRSDVIDMHAPREHHSMDKLGFRNFIWSLKSEFFDDPSYVMNKKRSEAFFNDLSNFRLPSDREN